MVSEIEVLLAVCNGARWLPEQLRSLREQDDSAFTVLMQDDGSADSSPALLEAAAREDPRFRFAREGGRHLGAAGNFFSLLRQAEAPYAALCDQDDVWTRFRLSRCRTVMAQLEAVHGKDTPLLVHSDCAVTDAEGRVIHDSFMNLQGWDPAVRTLRPLLVQNNVTGCTVLMNRALYTLAAAHANPRRVFMHDWFLAQTAAAFGAIGYVDAPLVHYRQHGDNAVGASRHGLLARGLHALTHGDEARARIALTYDQTQAFLDAFADDLPPEGRRDCEAYLATRALPKLRRVRLVQKGGWRMQSRTARWGQRLFG